MGRWRLRAVASSVQDARVVNLQLHEFHARMALARATGDAIARVVLQLPICCGFCDFQELKDLKTSGCTRSASTAWKIEIAVVFLGFCVFLELLVTFGAF